MLRISRGTVHPAGLISSLVALILLGASAEAQVVKPFKIKGVGAGPTGLPLPGQPPRMHYVYGQATHLGQHYGEGSVQTLTIDVFDPAGGRIAGRFGSGQPFVFTGANGDQLACDYGTQVNEDGDLTGNGTYELTILGFTPEGGLIVQALWIAEFVAKPELSTGKFAGVTGSWVMYARSAPFVLGSDDPVGYSWSGDGQLTFRKGR